MIETFKNPFIKINIVIIINIKKIKRKENGNQKKSQKIFFIQVIDKN